jgi:transcriptional regulator with PAS, ATPase and Fis domain
MTMVLVSDRPQKQRLSGKLVDMENRAIEDALEQTGGNRKQAADVLGISLRALQYKIKEYKIKK